MHKDFDGWNRMKKWLHYRETAPTFFHEREIWWCALGANLGHEQDGGEHSFQRPVVVLKRFNRELLLVLPLTSQEKPGPYYRKLSTGSSAILTQVRLISARRLMRKVRSTLPAEEFDRLREACFASLR